MRLGADRLLAVDPQFPVRLGLGPEPGDHLVDHRLEDRLAGRVGERARHHVAHDVAAGGQRGEQRGVDAGDEAAQVVLVDDVVLHTLAGGEAQLVVGELGDVVERQPLLPGDHAAGDRRPHHARVVEGELLLGARPAHVAIVLLVDPVELEQDLVVVLEIGLCPLELLADGATEVVAGELDVFGGRHRCRPHSVLSEPAQRPLRASSPSRTGCVHGQQPIDG